MSVEAAVDDQIDEVHSIIEDVVVSYSLLRPAHSDSLIWRPRLQEGQLLLMEGVVSSAVGELKQAVIGPQERAILDKSPKLL